MNKNAPYIREIIDRTKQLGGTRIVGTTKEETKQNALLVLKQQRMKAIRKRIDDFIQLGNQ